jgi:hypothetical protein
MKHTEGVCVALWFVLGSSATVGGRDEPTLDSRIIEALKAREPDWRPVTVLESGRVPLVPTERRIVAAVWENPKSHSGDVDVFVYGVANRDEAMGWLERLRNKRVSPGWQVRSHQLGDEGYLSKYKDGKRFEIEFRRGLVVAKIAGDALHLVKAFAKCVVEQIPASPKP